MKEIDVCLQKVFAQQRQPQQTPGPENENQTEDSTPVEREVTPWSFEPFYRVNSVVENSPANNCGLKTGDLIIKFGTILADTFTPKLVIDLVQSSVGRPIPVTVRRNPEGIMEFALIPKQWEGRGLLGCHLVPPV